jgi:hypothetical protein
LSIINKKTTLLGGQKTASINQREKRKTKRAQSYKAIPKQDHYQKRNTPKISLTLWGVKRRESVRKR